MNTTAMLFTRKNYPAGDTAIPVLHIIKSLGRGGAELLLPESLGKHNKEKYDFHYLYFLPWKNQVVREIEQAGGTVVCFPAKNNVQIVLKVRKIVAYVKTHHIQLIHCHLPWAGIVGRLVGRLTGIPVVYTEHNKWERYHRLTYYMNKLSFRSQQYVIAVSGEVARSIKTHYRHEKPGIQVVQNGIDTDKFSLRRPIERDIRKELNIPAHVTVIGIACVFRPQKRLDAWLEIASLVHKKYPDTYFIIAGDGGLRDEMHQKARTLNMKSCVYFAGLQTDIKPWLKAMDIFMMSSEFEGLPIALLEAMSMGCMPACTDAGGIPEVIQDNINGLLVPVNNPLQLADRLTAILPHRDQVEAMKQAARETVVHHFSMQKMVTHLENIYDNLLAKED
ncbi:glycosyltransferase [Paraflavitalea soli]|nr:glycosyltransferase [Paraflavitalea soli]